MVTSPERPHNVPLSTQRSESSIIALPSAPGPGQILVDEQHVSGRDNEKEVWAAFAVPSLPEGRKWWLLVIYSFAMFIDIWSYSSFFIFTNAISEDLDVVFEQQSWIITSYQVTFASVLLFWGRIVDLFSPRIVFILGFTALGVLNLVISFLPDKYSFFIFRALSGVAGASLIPASYRLITATFEGRQLQMALTLYGVSGAVANATGLIVSGVIELIPGTGQMKAWRWFFRVAAALVLPVAITAAWLIPKVDSPMALPREMSLRQKLKGVDIIGSLLMLTSIALFIIGLTFGASYGWSSASFIVPLVLAALSFPGFFFWEAKISEDHAILPPATWQIPNLACLTILGLFTYGYFSVNFLIFADVYMYVGGESSIATALRLLPEGIASLVLCICLTVYPEFVSQPRWPIVFGMLVGMVSLLLWIYASDIYGIGYWKYIFPGMVIGTVGVDTAFTGISVGVILSAPKEKAGVASAVLQVAFQAGSVIALAIQAGLLTIHPGSVGNWSNVRASLWFEFGWCAVWMVGFVAWYRPKAHQLVAEGHDIAH